MAIAPGFKTNMETLATAFEHGDNALVECTRKSDGKTVVLLCAIGFDGVEYQITPFAEMIDGNPFELYNPPEETHERNQTAQGARP